MNSRPTRSPWAALAAASLATSMTFVDATAIPQALPAIGTALDASSGQLVWVVAACAVPLALLLPAGGVLVDRYGGRPVLAAGIGLFAAGSAMSAAAADAHGLIAARVVQGVGGAMLVPGSLAVLAAAFGPGRRGRAIGAWSAWCAAATAAGPLIGGTLAEAGLWRGVFLASLPLAAAALLSLRRAPGGAGKRRLPHGLAAQKEIWRRPVVRSAAAAAFTLNTALYGLLLVLPLALIVQGGYRADQVAAAQVPLFLILIAACPLAGRWADRRGPRAPVCIGAALATAAMLWLMVGGVGSGGGATAEYLVRLLGPLGLLGLGVGLAVVPLTVTVMNEAGGHALGAAATVNALIARLGAAAAVALFGGILLAGGVALAPAGAAHAEAWDETFRTAMALAALLGATTIGIAARHLPAARPAERTAAPADIAEARP